MLATVLTVLALIGGVAVTYFVMDGPRRRAKELRLQLDEEQDVLRQERRENEEDRRANENRSGRLAEKVRDVRDAEAALDRRVSEFERRAIAYDDLKAENRLLKEDLRNMALLVARHEHEVAETSHLRTTLAQQRDLLAQAYLEEVRASTRKAITAINYPSMKRRIQDAMLQLEAAGVRPTEAGRKQIIDELHHQYEAAVRAAIERENQARIREQIREEQRREREAGIAIEQAENERRAVEKALQQALSDTAQVHAAEIERLRAQLAEAEAKSMRAIALAQLTKTGYVYVISNIGSFGRDVFKIGLTRREDPMERVWELGDASVPFPFDVHMMIMCEDAPKLERALHQAFDKKRVNKVNPRKEFFRVTIEEIVRAVREQHGEVKYTADAEALEYLQSQNMTDADIEEVKEAFEEAEETVGAGAED